VATRVDGRSDRHVDFERDRNFDLVRVRGKDDPARVDARAILLDLGLSGIDGLATLESALTFAPNVPIVVLTATEDPEMAARALEAGAAEYLIKEEVGPEELMDALFEAVSVSRTWSVPALPITCRAVMRTSAYPVAGFGLSSRVTRWLRRVDCAGFPTDRRDWS
jgi:CheY-like chemotaxis protein